MGGKISKSDAIFSLRAPPRIESIRSLSSDEVPGTKVHPKAKIVRQRLENVSMKNYILLLRREKELLAKAEKIIGDKPDLEAIKNDPSMLVNMEAKARRRRYHDEALPIPTILKAPPGPMPSPPKVKKPATHLTITARMRISKALENKKKDPTPKAVKPEFSVEDIPGSITESLKSSAEGERVTLASQRRPSRKSLSSAKKKKKKEVSIMQSFIDGPPQRIPKRENPAEKTTRTLKTVIVRLKRYADQLTSSNGRYSPISASQEDNISIESVSTNSGNSLLDRVLLDALVDDLDKEASVQKKNSISSNTTGAIENEHTEGRQSSIFTETESKQDAESSAELQSQNTRRRSLSARRKSVQRLHEGRGRNRSVSLSTERSALIPSRQDDNTNQASRRKRIRRPAYLSNRLKKPAAENTNQGPLNRGFRDRPWRRRPSQPNKVVQKTLLPGSAETSFDDINESIHEGNFKVKRRLSQKSRLMKASRLRDSMGGQPSSVAVGRRSQQRKPSALSSFPINQDSLSIRPSSSASITLSTSHPVPPEQLHRSSNKAHTDASNLTITSPLTPTGIPPETESPYSSIFKNAVSVQLDNQFQRSEEVNSSYSHRHHTQANSSLPATIAMENFNPMFETRMKPLSKPGQSKLFYAEPLTKSGSTGSNRVFPQIQNISDYQNLRAVKVVPTFPNNPDDILTHSQLSYYSNKYNNWRLTQIASENNGKKKVPKITLIKYKLEEFSNNYQPRDERMLNLSEEDGRLISSPSSRKHSLVAPGQRLSVMSGGSTHVLKVVEATPLTPVNVAPDITQFLFPDEVQELSKSGRKISLSDNTSLTGSRDSRNDQLNFRRSSTADSFTQTTDSNAHRRDHSEDVRGNLQTMKPISVSQPSIKANRRPIVRERRKITNNLNRTLAPKHKVVKRSTSTGPDWRF
ncbi:hypothetical protein FHG87_012303 [Trinorchestia longiramus]|nr:hypothetical protein FHG87_012303 [Trinorchestia longiramus]